MVFYKALVKRGQIIESVHKAKYLVKDSKKIIALSTNNDDDLVYPRSSIKLFQAVPFVISNASKKYQLNDKILAIACSSHCGENFHIKVLSEWINKIKLPTKSLLCGIHNPISAYSTNKLLLSGNMPSQLHNNCSGKHLAMLTGCLNNNLSQKNYVDFNHPYQKIIRDSLEFFTELKIKKGWYGVDGCNAPQYCFPMNSLVNAMVKLANKKDSSNRYKIASLKLLNAINKYPKLIGGTNRFDSEIIQITNGRIFCKGGAEGVLLFADNKKGYGGIIKIIDGNERAIPPIAMKIFSKLKLLHNKEKEKLKKWKNPRLFNHAKKEIGEILA